jgi:hypothetical protein
MGKIRKELDALEGNPVRERKMSEGSACSEEVKD